MSLSYWYKPLAIGLHALSDFAVEILIIIIAKKENSM